MTAESLFVTHYYRADRRPFANLSDLPDADIDAVLARLGTGSRRLFGPRYMALRRATQARMRDLFEEAGGHPVRRHPHYFVLGDSVWFADLYDEPRTVRLPLSRLPTEVTSFTWTDSFTALGLGQHLGVPLPPEEWQRGLHRLERLDPSRIAGRSAGEDGPYEGYERRPLQHYVEVQLWSDEPVAELLKASS